MRIRTGNGLEPAALRILFQILFLYDDGDGNQTEILLKTVLLINGRESSRHLFSRTLPIYGLLAAEETRLDLQLWGRYPALMLISTVWPAEQHSWIVTVLGLPPGLQPVGTKCGDDVFNLVAVVVIGQLIVIWCCWVAHKALLLLLVKKNKQTGRAKS